MSAGTASQVRFAIGPLCWGIAVQDFARWLETARAGARIIYAGGPVLPRDMAVYHAVKAALDAGRVSTHQARENGACVYIAERLPEPAAAASAPFPEPGSVAARMLEILRQTAARALPCPTNSVLAIALHLKDAEAARYVFGQLVRAGLIAVENRGPKARRIVTICATGGRTAG